MARPKPGDRDYLGPVHESVRAAQRSVDKHLKNAAGIPGDIEKNARKNIKSVDSSVRNFLDFGKGDREKKARKTAKAKKNAKAVVKNRQTGSNTSRPKAKAKPKKFTRPPAVRRPNTGKSTKPKAKKKPSNDIKTYRQTQIKKIQKRTGVSRNKAMKTAKKRVSNKFRGDT